MTKYFSRKNYTTKIFIAIILLFSIFSTIFSSQASAHALSASFGEMTINDNEINLAFSIDDLSVIESTNADANLDGKLSQEEVDSAQAEILEWMSRNLLVTFDGMVQRSGIDSMIVEPRNDLQVVTASFTYPISTAVGKVVLNDHFYENSADNTTYTHFLKVEQNGEVSEHLLKGNNRTFEAAFDPTTPVSNQSTWLSFLFLGMEHILFGFDHLLFLFALLLAKQSFKEYIKIVTAFTIAHSITITLGYLEIISLPGILVESVIALSICYVAIENIFRKGMKHRWTLTFVFGLIHGLGFAGMLHEMTIPKSHLVTALLSFNIGIEIVQIAIVAVVIPLLRYMQKFSSYTRTVQYGSALIVVIGAYWVVERVLGL
ncbi:HupE/UreJ family protein [Litchfieldia alkalitelluris]|uniref:HupE/UreJ family protein n=1 Tax=Litchfieldia alkalitelluris TaxID=304268 RepID=UPI0009970421|nr:HupE/UreJ family protein [Litchfieldia alkalitelluris]